VTLLAFGSGATDVFTSLSAADSATVPGVQLAVCSLLGGSLYNLAGVSAVVMAYSPEKIKMNK